MARINDQWLMQQVEGVVVLFNEYIDEQITEFKPSRSLSVANAIEEIKTTDKLNQDDKTLAIFWAGYFYGANHD
jgi:hypothetical protein